MQRKMMVIPILALLAALLAMQLVIAQPLGMVSYWKFDEGSGNITYPYENVT